MPVVPRKLFAPSKDVADVFPDDIHVPLLGGPGSVFRFQLVPVLDQFSLFLPKIHERWELPIREQVAQMQLGFRIRY